MCPCPLGLLHLSKTRRFLSESHSSRCSRCAAEKCVEDTSRTLTNRILAFLSLSFRGAGPCHSEERPPSVIPRSAATRNLLPSSEQPAVGRLTSRRPPAQMRPPVGTWRSLVAYLNGVQGVPGSNPGVPTNKTLANSNRPKPNPRVFLGFSQISLARPSEPLCCFLLFYWLRIRTHFRTHRSEVSGSGLGNTIFPSCRCHQAPDLVRTRSFSARRGRMREWYISPQEEIMAETRARWKRVFASWTTIATLLGMALLAAATPLNAQTAQPSHDAPPAAQSDSGFLRGQYLAGHVWKGGVFNPRPDVHPAGAHLTYYGGRVISNAQVVAGALGKRQLPRRRSPARRSPSHGDVLPGRPQQRLRRLVDGVQHCRCREARTRPSAAESFLTQITITPSTSATTIDDTQDPERS